ncbi:MAG: deoxyuridine 5'-triphosphate nucleotidohydrolase [Clostridia bacterium]|nr:deoxyuridine 5'-triphosphate nucleotidohydrolase [Clostridia bacterium]
MNRIARFESVSETQFATAWADTFGAEAVVPPLPPLPRRATAGSAGYDFFTPCAVRLAPGETAKIPTGVRVRMEEGWVLQIYPRSGLGFSYRLQLNNTVGIIDSDYYFSNNEGHIFIKITNDSNEGKILQLQTGDGFAQGIFVPFGITEDDNAVAIRNGGFGSTSK